MGIAFIIKIPKTLLNISLSLPGQSNHEFVVFHSFCLDLGARWSDLDDSVSSLSVVCLGRVGKLSILSQAPHDANHLGRGTTHADRTWQRRMANGV